jgi:hypothetical protein
LAAAAAAGGWYVKQARGIKGKQVERYATAVAARASLCALPVDGQGAGGAGGAASRGGGGRRRRGGRRNSNSNSGINININSGINANINFNGSRAAGPAPPPERVPHQAEYVVQREAAPLLLADGRRFCLGQHVLLVLPPPPCRRGCRCRRCRRCQRAPRRHPRHRL